MITQTLLTETHQTCKFSTTPSISASGGDQLQVTSVPSLSTFSHQQHSWYGQKEFLHCYREFVCFGACLHIDRLTMDKKCSFYPNVFIIESRRACQSRDKITILPANCCGFKHVHAQSYAALISILHPSSCDEIQVTCLTHSLSIHLLLHSLHTCRVKIPRLVPWSRILLRQALCSLASC